MTQHPEHQDQDPNARRMVPYALSDGSTVLVDASAAKGASVIDYTLKGGRIVQATKVSLQEAQDDAYSIPQAHIEAAQQLSQAISAVLATHCPVCHTAYTPRTAAATYAPTQKVTFLRQHGAGANVHFSDGHACEACWRSTASTAS